MAQTKHVNITPNDTLPRLHLSQYDVGRELSFKLYDGAVSYTVPTGATVKLMGTKPSGFGFTETCTVSGSTASISTTAGMTDEFGGIPCELVVEKSGVRLGSTNIMLVIEKSPHPEGTTDGRQEVVIPELTVLVERVEAAASSILDMQVEVETLPAGSQATYSYDEDTNTQKWGVPQGEAGAGAAGTLANAYSSSATYAVGDYVLHNSNLYVCTTAITTAESFTAAHWSQVVLADGVTDLKADFDNVLASDTPHTMETTESMWGKFTITTGTTGPAEYIIGTTGYRYEVSSSRLSLRPLISFGLIKSITLKPANGYKASFISFDSELTERTDASAGWKSTEETYYAPATGLWSVVFGKTNDGSISLSEFSNLEITITYKDGRIIDTVYSRFAKEIVSPNWYDESTNGVVQSDTQYTVGTVYLPDNYIGNAVISCDGSQYGYITNLVVYNANDEDMGVAFGDFAYSPLQLRSGKSLAIPSGAKKVSFKYRTTYSGGTLVKDVMFTKGVAVPDYYVSYSEKDGLSNSAYLTEIEIDEVVEKVAYVSLNGSDSNDGLSFGSALASIQKALTISRKVKIERGTYNQAIRIADIDNIVIEPYDNDETYAHANPIRAKIAVNTAMFTNCNNLHIEDMSFAGAQSSALRVYESNNVVLNNCEAHGSTSSNGFDLVNTNAILNNCYAYENKYDGFNFHGYGTTVMNDCISENNEDDGVSHHDGCIGTINGGRFSNNGKAGIAPAYGANVNIYDVVCDSNVIGIGYLSTNDGHASMKGIVSSSVMIGNTKGLQVDPLCSVIAINCKYSGNTTDKVVTGTLNEY